MTPESLLEHLEAAGTVDANTLRKLRRRVENPEKSSSVNQILSWLVKHEFLTKEDAIRLLQGETQPPDEAVGSEGRPAKDHHQSDELLAGVLDQGDEPSEDDIGLAEDAEAADEVADDEEELTQLADDFDDLEPAEVDPAELEAEYLKQPDELEAETVAAIPEQVPEAAPATIATEVEHFPDPMTTDIGQLSAAAHPSVKNKTKIGFAGKLDNRDQWATKWVFIGFGILGLLMVAGLLLVFVLGWISAEDRFEAANRSLKAGTYGDAIKRYDEFLEKHPNHEDVPKAKVSRVEALLAETYQQQNWDETIIRAQKNLPELVNDGEVDLDPIREVVAIMLPTSTLEIARRATSQTSKSALVEQLAKAKEAKKLVDDPVLIPNSKRKRATVAKLLDSVEEEISRGEGLIRKQEDFDRSLVEIQSHREQSEPDKAFAVYNSLIRSYGDLRANETLQQEMRLVSQLESRLVKAVKPGVTTTTALRATPITATTLLAATTGKSIESLVGEIVPVLADGSVYGVDVGDGSVRWRHFTGYQTGIQPAQTDANVLISDQANHDLMLVKAADGSLVWRCEIGEQFVDPVIEEGIILLTTQSGRLVKLELATGSALSAVQIPQTANVPMTRAGRTGTIVQPGYYSNLYLLSDQDLSCQDVYYLGHNRGSISAPAVVWNNMVLVAVNQSGVCDLHVLRPREDGVGLELAQRIRRVTRGNVVSPLQRFGRFMLIVSETGDLKILELNTAEENSPVRILAEETFENRDAVRTWVTTAGSQMWVGVKGLTRYKVSRALATFNRAKLENPDDLFIGPIRKFGDSLIHVRKREDSAMTSISAVDADSLDQIWRTDLGGANAGPPIVFGNRAAAVSSQGDLFRFNVDTNDSVASDAVKSSAIVEDLVFDRLIQLSSSAAVALSPPGRADLLFIELESFRSRLMRLPDPADQASSRPAQLAGHLIIPTSPGQVVRIDPKNAAVVGTPFLPPVKPGTLIDWQEPAVIGDSTVVVGGGKNVYLLDASNTQVLAKIGEVVLEGKLKSRVAAAGNLAFGVVGGKPTDQLIALAVDTGAIGLAGSSDLGGQVSAGPWTAGNIVLVQIGGKLIGLDHSLNTLWSLDATGSLATDPIADAGQLIILFADGRVLAVNPESGEVISDISLGQPIAHQPVAAGNITLISGRDGTVHAIKSGGQ